MKYVELKNYVEYLRISLDDSFSKMTTVPKNLLMTNMEYCGSYANAVSNTDLLCNREVWNFEEIVEIVKQFRYITCDSDKVTLNSYLYNAIKIAGLDKESQLEDSGPKFKSKAVRESLKNIMERCKTFVICNDYTRCFEVLINHIGKVNYSRLQDTINVLNYDLIIDVFSLFNDIGFNEEVFDCIASVDDRSEAALCKNMLIIIKNLHLSEDEINNIYDLILNNQFADLEKKYYEFMRRVPNFVNLEVQLDELSMKNDIFSEHLSSTLKIYDKVINSSPFYEYTWVNELEVLYPFKNKYKNYKLDREEKKCLVVQEKKSLRNEQKEQICELLNLGIPVMLVGPYGCGKESLFNSAALEYASRYGKEFIYRSGDKYRSIDEFMNAYSFLFKNGGIFYLRGYDSALQDVVDEINSSKRYQIISDTSCGDELASESKDFRLGVGVDTYYSSKREYCGDTILRVTDIDKYVSIDVTYDDILEESLLESDKHLYNYIKAARDVFAARDIKHFITTGDIVTAKKMIDSGKYKREDIISMVILKHLSIEALTTIENEMNTIFKGTNPYNSALSLILKNKKRTT